jgi:amino acid transporter
MPLRQLREWLIGSPLPTHRLAAQRLDTARALAALSPDALSSIAYANQEIFLGLVVAGAAGLTYSLPIALAIAGLLVILTLSYSQTIRAYPAGGGSYTVARENIGVSVGLVAAAALMTDYVLVAAVSLTAGVAAISSAFPAIEPYRVGLSLLLLAIITIANLRGIHESSTLMSIPVYLFIVSYLGMLAYGVTRAITEGPGSYLASSLSSIGEAPITAFLILHTFASGCTALTGIEAISNGTQMFQPPESKHAVQAMRIMALSMGLLFLGTVGLTQFFAVTPAAEETVLSALARRIFGSGGLYIFIQASTLLILLVAANTSFAGFPRLASILARDGYLPRQLSYLGDRLVFSNGMILLAALTGILILLFAGDTHALIPLFAVGVFVAFTLSQAGMVLHWIREREQGWQLKTLTNGLGALTTAVALSVIAISKFADGAWIVMLLIPIFVLGFRAVHKHYEEIASELSLSGVHFTSVPLPSPRIVMPIPGVHRGVITALRYALSISNQVIAVYVEIDPDRTEKVLKLWKRWGSGVPLEVVPSPYRSFVGPFLEFLDRTDQEHGDGQLATVLLPEFIPAKWWENLLHNQTAWILKIALLYRRRRYGKVRAIIDIPTQLRH